MPILARRRSIGPMVDREERRKYWNERYASDGSVFGTEPNVFVAELLADAPPGHVLDMGCGQGRNALWLARHGHQVTAVDQSDVAIEQARRLALEAGLAVGFEAVDLVEWEPEPAAYDIVMLSYLQLEAARRVVAHHKAVAAAAPGGMVLLIAHHADNLTAGYGGPDTADVMWTPEDLEEDFAALDIERNEAVLRTVETPEGPRSAIDLLMIARKPPS